MQEQLMSCQEYLLIVKVSTTAVAGKRKNCAYMVSEKPMGVRMLEIGCAYRGGHDDVYHRDIVENISTDTSKREVRPLKHDRTPTSDEQYDDWSSVGAVEKDGAARDICIESNSRAQVE